MCERPINQEPQKGAQLQGVFQALPTNIRQGWKGLSGTNTNIYVRKKFRNIGAVTLLCKLGDFIVVQKFPRCSENGLAYKEESVNLPQ